MLFIFGRLLVSGSAVALGPPRDLTCTPARKNLRDVTGLVVLTHSASLLFFIHPLFSIPNLFPLYLSTSPQKHPSRHYYIHLLFSWHILSCYCFSFRLVGPVFTNGLLPYVPFSLASIIIVWYIANCHCNMLFLSTWFIRLFAPILAVCCDHKQRAGRDPSPCIFIWSRC